MRRKFLLLSSCTLLAASFPALTQAQQVNTSNGTNRDAADSAFQLYWDSAADVWKFRCAASGSAGSAITWNNGPSLDTSCTMSGGVATPSADSLDFTEFLDAMALDASTSITADNAEVLSIVNTGTGNSFLVQDVASDTSPFVIDAAGLVGIGTASPATMLDIITISGGAASIRLSANANYPHSYIQFLDTSGGGGMELGADYNQIYFMRNDYTNGSTSYYSGYPMIMVLQRTTGNVGIGTPTPNDGKVEVKGGSVCVDTNSDDSATSCITNESDIRLKKNIKPIEGALDKIKQLRGVEFDWRWDEFDVASRWKVKPHAIGVIAQDVEKVFPEAMGEENDGFKTVEYEYLIAPMIEAMKEQQRQIEDLQARLEAVENSAR